MGKFYTSNTTSPMSWSNADNAPYYEAIPPETLRKYAKLGGFENGCDIDIVFNQIKGAKSILEIGAGYGRVLHNLLKRGYSGKLYAIERSKNLHTHLQKNFSQSATIIHTDINHFHPDIQFDVIMWMWSSISDFAKAEHVPILKHITGWLKEGGMFVLDTISHLTKLADEFTVQNQTYVEKATHGTAYGYIPSTDEMQKYAEILNLKAIHLPYTTDTDRPRIIHIFKKEFA